MRLPELPNGARGLESALSALWLPANNKQMEGRPVLILGDYVLILSDDHAVMTADLYAVVGFIVAAVTVARRSIGGDGGDPTGPRRPAVSRHSCWCFGLGAALAAQIG